MRAKKKKCEKKRDLHKSSNMCLHFTWMKSHFVFVLFSHDFFLFFGSPRRLLHKKQLSIRQEFTSGSILELNFVRLKYFIYFTQQRKKKRFFSPGWKKIMRTNERTIHVRHSHFIPNKFDVCFMLWRFFVQ